MMTCWVLAQDQPWRSALFWTQLHLHLSSQRGWRTCWSFLALNKVFVYQALPAYPTALRHTLLFNSWYCLCPHQLSKLKYPQSSFNALHVTLLSSRSLPSYRGTTYPHHFSISRFRGAWKNRPTPWCRCLCCIIAERPMGWVSRQSDCIWNKVWLGFGGFSWISRAISSCLYSSNHHSSFYFYQWFWLAMKILEDRRGSPEEQVRSCLTLQRKPKIKQEWDSLSLSQGNLIHPYWANLVHKLSDD